MSRPTALPVSPAPPRWWRRRARWSEHNAVELLENGEAYFPAVNQAISQARHEVLIETFILFDDGVGQALHAKLREAAQRGVTVHLLLDGFGCADLPAAYTDTLIESGVQVRVFDPGPRVFGHRLNLLRRMHRKTVVVDGELAFVGGINFGVDQLALSHPQGKQDYAVAIRGPLVASIRRLVLRAIGLRPPPAEASRPTGPDVSVSDAGRASARVLLATRDNRHHSHDIERHYRMALRAARDRVIIANAYFFPSYLLIRSLRRAAQRGVDVRLILQGEPDLPIAQAGARLLYAHLQRAGVKIYEYAERPLHAKVAVVDQHWSTVGSSNLDPLSLSLNLEVNVIVDDPLFNAELTQRLDTLMASHCVPVAPPRPPARWDRLKRLRSHAVYHLLRWLPTWAGWLPQHRPLITPLMPADARPAPGFSPARAQEAADQPAP